MLPIILCVLSLGAFLLNFFSQYVESRGDIIYRRRQTGQRAKPSFGQTSRRESAGREGKSEAVVSHVILPAPQSPPDTPVTVRMNRAADIATTAAILYTLGPQYHSKSLRPLLPPFLSRSVLFLSFSFSLTRALSIVCEREAAGLAVPLACLIFPNEKTNEMENPQRVFAIPPHAENRVLCLKRVLAARSV